MSDPLAGSRLKLARAEHHVGNLRDVTDRFLETKPYRIRSEFEKDGSEKAWYLESVDEIDPTIALIAGDAIQNLRSSLDYIIYRLAERKRRRPLTEKEAKHPQFVLCTAPAAFPNQQWHIEMISKRAQATVRALQPHWPKWKRLNVLGTLATLSDIDKHRRLSLLLARGDVLGWEGSIPGMKVLDSSGTLKEGAEICRVRFPKGHRYVDVNPHIALSIAAADASGWATQPLANMLGMTILYVRSIVLPRFDRLFR